MKNIKFLLVVGLAWGLATNMQGAAQKDGEESRIMLSGTSYGTIRSADMETKSAAEDPLFQDLIEFFDIWSGSDRSVDDDARSRTIARDAVKKTRGRYLSSLAFDQICANYRTKMLFGGAGILDFDLHLRMQKWFSAKAIELFKEGRFEECQIMHLLLRVFKTDIFGSVSSLVEGYTANKILGKPHTFLRTGEPRRLVEQENVTASLIELMLSDEWGWYGEQLVDHQWASSAGKFFPELVECAYIIVLPNMRFKDSKRRATAADYFDRVVRKKGLATASTMQEKKYIQAMFDKIVRDLREYEDKAKKVQQ